MLYYSMLKIKHMICSVLFWFTPLHFTCWHFTSQHLHDLTFVGFFLLDLEPNKNATPGNNATGVGLTFTAVRSNLPLLINISWRRVPVIVTCVPKQPESTAAGSKVWICKDKIWRGSGGMLSRGNVKMNTPNDAMWWVFFTSPTFQFLMHISTFKLLFTI